jgi:uncharacterized protein YuzB (UPF0349 family)
MFLTFQLEGIKIATNSMRAAGFEPARTNTSQLECDPLDQLGQTRQTCFGYCYLCGKQIFTTIQGDLKYRRIT